jgi:hypothetical protein
VAPLSPQPTTPVGVPENVTRTTSPSRASDVAIDLGLADATIACAHIATRTTELLSACQRKLTEIASPNVGGQRY